MKSSTKKYKQIPIEGKYDEPDVHVYTCTHPPITEKVYANSSAGRIIGNTELNRHFTIQDTLRVRGLESDTWEIFSFEQQSSSNYIAIKNRWHGKYLEVEPDFFINGSATVITGACLFRLVTPDGGYVPEGLKISDLAHLQGLSGNIG